MPPTQLSLELVVLGRTIVVVNLEKVVPCRGPKDDFAEPGQAGKAQQPYARKGPPGSSRVTDESQRDDEGRRGAEWPMCASILNFAD